MYSGKLQRVTFKFSGPSLEAVFDRDLTDRPSVIRRECIKFARKFVVMVYKYGSEVKEIGLKI